jgi:hypothetical protein
LKEYTIKFKISKARDIFNPFKPEFVLINLYDNQGDFVQSIYSGFLRPGEQQIKFDLRGIKSTSSFFLYTIQISNGEFYWGKFFYLK